MPLVLDLLRHGEAAPSSPGGDASRPLTPSGEAAIADLARRLAADGGGWDRAFTSPLLRARQTAAIVLAASAGAPEPGTLAELGPDGEPEDVVVALRALGAESGRVLLVGHMPLLGVLAGHLGGGHGVALTPGELLRLEFPAGLARGEGRRVRSLRGGSSG